MFFLDDSKEETAIGKIRTAKGNELIITGDTLHYVIKGTNVKGDKSAKGYTMIRLKVVCKKIR